MKNVIEVKNLSKYEWKTIHQAGFFVKVKSGLALTSASVLYLQCVRLNFRAKIRGEDNAIQA